MRQIPLLFVIFLLMTACRHGSNTSKDLEQDFEKRVKQKSDTLIVGRGDCTECQGLNISQGTLTIPTDILNNIKFGSTKYINICGDFPKDLIDITNASFDSKLKFKVIGKVIKMDSTNNNGILPLFYVDSWEKFYFDKRAWASSNDSISYPARQKMIHGIIKNILFSGQHVSDLTNLLGEPNHIDSNEIVYDIDDKYESGIDPVASTFFIITFDKDSVITGKTLSTTKYGR